MQVCAQALLHACVLFSVCQSVSPGTSSELQTRGVFLTLLFRTNPIFSALSYLTLKPKVQTPSKPTSIQGQLLHHSNSGRGFGNLGNEKSAWMGGVEPSPPNPALSDPCSLHGPLKIKWDWILSPCSGADLSRKYHCLGSDVSQLGIPPSATTSPRNSGDTYATCESHLIHAFGHLSCAPQPSQACSSGLCSACLPDSPQGLCARQMLMELNLAARMVVALKLEVVIRGERRLGVLLCGCRGRAEVWLPLWMSGENPFLR